MPQYRRLHRWLLYALGAGFILAGTMHFVRTPFYVRMMPPPLNAHALLLVYISGVCEILGGAGVFFAYTRKAAGIGLLALLAAVFPANAYMAVRWDLFADVGSRTALLLRLPVQLVFAVWVWWCCLSE